MLPRPTAEPAAAKIKPILLENCVRFFSNEDPLNLFGFTKYTVNNL